MVAFCHGDVGGSSAGYANLQADQDSAPFGYDGHTHTKQLAGAVEPF